MRRALLVVALLVGCGSSSSTQPGARPSDRDAARVETFLREPMFEVASEDVTFSAGGRTVPGTLARPRTAGKRPAIVLLAGSGPTDRDWNSPAIPTKNGSGALLALELARRGAVVLRFDKAGSGKNPGPHPERWTLDTYREEAVAALALLRTRPDVRADRVFVIGHSEGGMHATRLAQVETVAGVCYLASLSRSMVDTMLSQIEAQLKNPAAMLSERAIDTELAGLRDALADFMAGKRVDPQRASKIPQLQQLVAGIVNPTTATLMRALIGFDNAAEAAKLPGPFFVLAGGKDVQVDVELDAKRLDRSLRDAGRDVTFHLAPDADHVLKHEPKSKDQIRANLLAAQNAYNAADRTLDADAVRALADWLAARSR
jgi:hypothetical protein